MHISNLYKTARPVVSIEVFPPKKDSTADQISDLYRSIDALAALRPDFISVTYGAGGGASRGTAAIAAHIEDLGVPALAHLTCIGTNKHALYEQLKLLSESGIENVLALRGDIPQGVSLANGDFTYASDMIAEVSRTHNFCLAAACYPEGHIAAPDLSADIAALKIKQDAGAEFFISQLFFDNDHFFRFAELARKSGITAPISAGVMPMFSKAQVSRMIFMCGASLPAALIKLIHKYENDPPSLEAAGVEYAERQIRALREAGVDGVHLYCMNRPEVGAKLYKAARG